MPIRINLLADAIAAEELRRKDPVKRAIWLAVLIVSLIAIWSLMLQSKIILASSKLNTLEADWRSIEKPFLIVQTNQAELVRFERNLSALRQLRTNRFLWGSSLNTLQQSVVDGVRVTRLRAEQTYTQTEGTPDRTNELRIVRGRPGVATERMVLTIEGRDFTPNVVGHVRFKEALANSPFFQSSGQKTNVFLDNLPAPSSDPLSPSGTSVPFTLKLLFPDKERAIQ
jgi:hypothetical protein